jgi:hypothetical protein
MHKTEAIWAAVLQAAGMASASGDVIDVDPAGFQTRNEVVIRAAPDNVWDALLRAGRWWDPEHTYSGDARRMSIDPRPGGCFCERPEDRGGIKHAEIIYAAPGKALRMFGALGPCSRRASPAA